MKYKRIENQYFTKIFIAYTLPIYYPSLALPLLAFFMSKGHNVQ